MDVLHNNKNSCDIFNQSAVSTQESPDQYFIRLLLSCSTSRPLYDAVVHSDKTLGVIHAANSCVVVKRLLGHFELWIHRHLLTEM